MRIWKFLRQLFCSSLFQTLKKHTCKSENFWDSYLLIAFSNIKKAYLWIWNFLRQFFCSSLFQISKKHTCESQNTPFHTNNNFKRNNLHKNHHIITICMKNHYTNNLYKNYYANNFYKNHHRNNFVVINQINKHKVK